MPLWLCAFGSLFLVLPATLDELATEKQITVLQLSMGDNIFRASISAFIYPLRMFSPDAGRVPFLPVVTAELSNFHRCIGLLATLAILSLLALSFWICFLVSAPQSSLNFPRPAVGGLLCSSVYLILLMPCLQLFVQHGDVVWYADRYGYLPLAIVLPLMACTVCHRCPARGRLLLVAALGPLVLNNVLRCRDACNGWRSGVVLWSAAVAAEPAWAEFHHQLGVSLAATGNYTEAESSLKRAWVLRPDPLTAKALGQLLGIQYPELGVHWLLKALEPFHGDGLHDPRVSLGLPAFHSASVYHDLAALKGRLPLPNVSEVITLYKQSILLAPNRALTQESCGLALAVAGQYEEALVHLREAQRLGQNSAELHNGLGVAFLEKGKLKKAQASFRKAVMLRPDWLDPRENLLVVQAEMKRR